MILDFLMFGVCSLTAVRAHVRVFRRRLIREMGPVASDSIPLSFKPREVWDSMAPPHCSSDYPLAMTLANARIPGT